MAKHLTNIDKYKLHRKNTRLQKTQTTKKTQNMTLALLPRST